MDIKLLQTFLNTFNKTNLIVDGIIGPKTSYEIKIFLEKLRLHFIKYKLEWKENLFMGLRVDDIFDDLFSDYFLFIENNEIINIVKASTLAGYISVQKGIYNLVNGKNGVGALVENQQINYQVVEAGDDNFWNPYWTGVGLFLYQDEDVYIYRDDNTNLVLDKNTIQYGWFGMNVHSWVSYESNNVGELSAGCQVTKYKDFKNIVAPFIKRNMKKIKGKNRILYTLIKM